ncbi:MAG: hypothetical protein DIZ80_13975 [endosymbiont of Galathealinum brachiosum]|uniref:Sulfotransferase domain-containing protein n=1 Tax=endosymbiont of Galathealinum brachiosum TaxID=2200906 RepID=A0A370D9G5_9GAMM|nr:MAG: hypothetical protein DIZ80_13975 [endosymbiont of Galathealinum brachiosum]
MSNYKKNNKCPDFFIVGAPKSGTTSFYHYLDGCDEIYMSDIKEPNYFSCSDIKNQNLYYKVKSVCDYDQYLSLFGNASTEQLRGEASVSYLYYPEVASKIYRYNQNAKIIIALRNPVERAISHFEMDSRLGYVDKSLNQVLEGGDDNFYQQYIKLGLYYDQVKRYLDVFGEDQVKIFLFDEIVEDSYSVFLQILLFLNVDESEFCFDGVIYNDAIEGKNKYISFLYRNTSFRCFVSKLIPENIKLYLKALFFKKSIKKTVDCEIKEKLFCFYKDDIGKLQKLINRDLSHWVDAK